MFRILLLALAVVLTPQSLAFAESNTTVWENMNDSANGTDSHSLQDNESSPTTELGIGDAIKTFGILIFVICLILGVFYFVKKNRDGNFNQNQLFENIGSHSLGNQRSLQVVRMNGLIFILGVSDSIQLIKEINDPQEVKEFIHKQSVNDNVFATKFQKQLDQIKSNHKQSISKLIRKEQNDD